MSKANTICVDFDWTLCSNDKFGKPNKDVVELIKELCKERYEIIIYTSRSEWREETLRDVFLGNAFKNKNGYNMWCNKSIEGWLKKHKLTQYIKDVEYGKPEAVAYLDDRAIRHNLRNNNHYFDELGIYNDKTWNKMFINAIKEESERLLK